MNTTATYETEHSWSRRCSTETVFSIQGKETDIARDTSDTDASFSDTDRDLEYEPASEPENEVLFNGSTSSDSDNAIIKTKVIKVSIEEDGDLWAADSEWTETYESDSEIDHNDYWQCARCRTDNNNPLYRYCQKCFQLRKSFFPPRPKRKKRVPDVTSEQPAQTCSQDSGLYSQMSQPSSSQELLQEPHHPHQHGTSHSEPHSSDAAHVNRRPKRRAESVDRRPKRARKSDSDTESDVSVQKLVKMASDPSITVDDSLKSRQNETVDSLKENLESNELCIVCYSQPKSGVFVHGRIAHICCCYKCAVKVWTKAKRCPVCNCKIRNVLKAVVM